MTMMVVRDTAVGVGPVVFLTLLAGVALVVRDPFTIGVIGFLMVGAAHAAVGILTSMAFKMDA